VHAWAPARAATRTAVSRVCVFCIKTPKSIIPHANGTNINATIAISTAIAPCSLTWRFAWGNANNGPASREAGQGWRQVFDEVASGVIVHESLPLTNGLSLCVVFVKETPFWSMNIH
jgi:hypothetical protein